MKTLDINITKSAKLQQMFQFEIILDALIRHYIDLQKKKLNFSYHHPLITTVVR